MNPTQFINLVTAYVKICKDLKALVGDIRGNRTHVDCTGMGMPEVMSMYTFPLPGELSHITNADQWLAMLACWEGLFSKFADKVEFVKADGTNGTTIVAKGLYDMVP